MPDFDRDLNGNMTSDDVHNYKYDGLDRLIQVENKTGGVVASYTYNFAGTPSNLQTRTDANGVTEVFRTSINQSFNEFAIYKNDIRESIYINLPSEDSTESLVFEKREADGSNSVYLMLQDFRGNVTHLLSIDDNLNATLIQRYEYTLKGELTVFDANDNLTTDRPICRLLFRSSYYDEATGFYFISNRFYSPRLGQFISPDPFVKFNGFSAALYDLPWDPVEREHLETVERARVNRLEIQRRHVEIRNRRIELDRRNRDINSGFDWFIIGVGKAFGNMILELLRMGIDLTGGNYAGGPVSAIGKARAQGAGWGDIGEAAVDGILQLPGRWCDAAWEGDMEGLGTATTDIVLFIDGGVTILKAIRPGRVRPTNTPLTVLAEESSIPALGRPIPHQFESEAAFLRQWEEMIHAEKLSRRPHLNRNPVGIIANRSEKFPMDIYNMAACVNGNPANPRTMLFTSPGRHDVLFNPWDLTRQVGDTTLLELLQDKFPPWLLKNLEKNGTAMRTVGDVDEILRALWAYERKMHGTGFAAGHRADLAINLIQTRFENRFGLMIIEGYAKGNETMAEVIRNLFVPQWGSANSSMGGGLTASISTGLPRYYGLRLPEGTPIRLLGVQRRRGRSGR